MNAIKEIKTLRTTAHILETLLDKYNEQIEKPKCDKFGCSFGGDLRFSVFKTTIFFDCHTGWYGDSSCSSLANVDSELAEKLLNDVLNSMKSEILNKMAERAKSLATALIDKAQAEIDALQSSIDAAKEEAP
jgi:hypothetical protein